MPIRVLIADDHEVIRTGLTALMTGASLDVVGQASNGAETVRMAKEVQPDVVLLDIRMPEGDGLVTLGKLKAELPNLPVLMLSTYDNPTYISQAAAGGASGYVLKGCTRNELLSAIENVAAGKTAWVADEGHRSRTEHTTSPTAMDLEVPLTKREVEVLCQVATGQGNKEIARNLHISVETVKEHVHNILGKLNASGRTQAAVWAVRHGLA